MSEFESATAVQQVDERRFTATVHPGWDIAGNANGGYLLAIAARAMAAVTGRPPLTITAHYLAPAPAGECTVDVELIRAGRRMATATASLRQGDRRLLHLIGTFAEQTPGGFEHVTGGPPDLPPFDECGTRPDPTGMLPGLMSRVAVRLRPGDTGFASGNPTGTGEVAGWFAFADERPIDAYGLLLAVDAFPPPVFNTSIAPGWVPTLELTAHLRGVPAPGPLRCVFRSHHVHGGLIGEDGEVWDSAGTLVAQSRQLALIPRG